MSEPAPLSTTEALDALVHQFADPLAFLRELVQNSIDAGSKEIDVSVDYQDSLLEIRVDDYGEGMTRHVIDTRLTRLFSSSKEGDQTKIGRFGIGFVSIFAIQPDAVVLDTARGGERWRVIFRADRSFERIALRMPVDGTKIRILKRAERALYDEVRRRAPEVLARYCRHTEVEIRFHGKPINEPFDLSSPCKVTHREDGIEVVVGYAEGEASAGYYNRGLTLHEEALPDRIYSFKINSRHLEHTLTRDNVLRDAAYDALMARVRKLGERTLPAQLFERLEAAVSSSEPDATAEALYPLAARQIVAWGGASSEGFDGVAERRVARTLRGEPVSLRSLLALGRTQELYLSAGTGPIAEALAARGDLIVRCPPSGALPELLRALGISPSDAAESFCSPRPVDGPLPPAQERLAAALLDLLRRGGAGASAVRFGRFEGKASAASLRLAVVQRSLGELTDMARACRSPFAADVGEPFELTLNVDHPRAARLFVLAEHEPELAAHLTCKLLLVGDDLSPARDGQLAQHAFTARWQRSKS